MANMDYPQPGPSTAAMLATSQHSKIRACYFFDESICNIYYGTGHPMKPHRIRVAHDTIMSYQMWKHMEIYRPHRADPLKMMEFHEEDYVWFLRNVTPANKKDYGYLINKYRVETDCPVFDGIFTFCQLSSGGTISAAHKLNSESNRIAINWSGGMHHAKKDGASGFCYINDIVLGILELLKKHQRVLYVDIDVHHGDGVEEAFLTTDRVMTVSFHKFGDNFFPGTGDVTDVGFGEGKHYALNVPLLDGIDDKAYESIFTPVMTKVMEYYRPDAIVLQCGADSLAGDRLGNFNLTLTGHGNCVSFLLRYNLPIMLLGGGGYTVKNVARAWTYETSLAVGMQLPNKLPRGENPFVTYFSPTYCLHYPPLKRCVNLNTKKYLQDLKVKVLENLRDLPCAPSVEMMDVPGPSAMAEVEVVAPAGKRRKRGKRGKRRSSK